MINKSSDEAFTTNQIKPNTVTTVANVFNATSYETLKAVSVLTANTQSTVSIKVYKGKAPEAFNSKPIITHEEFVQYAGFHTVPLPKTLDLLPKEDYTITQEITFNKDGENHHFIPIELGLKEEEHFYYPTATIEMVVLCNKGESFFKTNNNWIDISTLEKKSPIYAGNAMIKAYTDNRSATAGELLMADITALGNITSLNQESWVVSLRERYNALDEMEKAKVTNLEILVAAELKINELKANAKAEASETAKSPGTGDNANIKIYLILAILSLAGISIICFRKKIS